MSEDERVECECPCHRKGDPGEGYTYIWDDDRGIRHEDWITCRCGCARALLTREEAQGGR